MNKFWRVFAYEYLRHVMRKRFIIAVISLPLFIVVIMGISILSVTLSMDQRPMGYVDLSGLLDTPPDSSLVFNRFSTVSLVRFETEQDASEAFEAEQIQGYYVVEEDYLITGQIRLFANEAPESSVRNRFANYLRTHLVQDQPVEIAHRLVDGHEFELITPEGTQTETPIACCSSRCPSSRESYLLWLSIPAAGTCCRQLSRRKKTGRSRL
jgi:ABC-2 type transport system permease protein